MSLRRTGLPVTVRMRHNSHYVEEIMSRTGAAIGRMIALQEIEPDPHQPRKDVGDLRELTESISEKGVLEPLLVRHVAETGKYLIISGERRYRAARAAGLREVPCIERDADDAESLELALVENLQRKDLTPFEEADGIQALVDRFSLTHEEIARRISKGRSSVTEILSLRQIPDSVKALCIQEGVLSKSRLLQVARQTSEARMRDLVRRFAEGSLSREQAREERQPKKTPPANVFRFVPPTRDFKLLLQFRKNSVQRQDVVEALRRILQILESQP